MTPTERLYTMMAPKCTGSIPISVTIGRKIGVKIRMAGVGSMKVPTTSRMIIMMTRMTCGLSVRPRRPADTTSGMWAKVIMNDRAEATPMRSVMMAVVCAASTSTSGSLRTSSCRYAKPSTRQYTTAMPADSVGVNQPARMPPTTMTIMSSDGMAFQMVNRATLNVSCSSLADAP